jgi:integrase
MCHTRWIHLSTKCLQIGALHGLRRTFASLLVALGHDAAYVMAQLGHTSPQMTLGLYAKSIRPADRERLRALVDGEKFGTNWHWRRFRGSSAE